MELNTPGFLSAADAEKANTKFYNALMSGHGPDTFLWRARPAANFKQSPYALDHSRAKEAFADSLRVRREPCPTCGVREDRHDDHGCGR